jgi:glutamine synthetase
MAEEKNYGFDNQHELVSRINGKDSDIKYVRFITADIPGEVDCNFTVPTHTIDNDSKSLRKGFDASSLYPARINESDKIAIFDPKTARVLPVIYGTKTPGFERKWREVAVWGDVVDQEGLPYVYDSRHILKKVLESAKKISGADKVYLGPEAEFFLFQADEQGRPIIKDNKPILMDKGQYFKSGKFGNIRKEIQLLMEEMGYKFEYDHHEVANSQHEIDVHYMDALDMADFMMLYRGIVKKVANAHGLFASFMPKPVLGVNGSGMHVHQSLFEGKNNLFFDNKDKHNLSTAAYQYMAGLMKYIPEVAAFTNQWVNSYRRLVPGFEAPVYICWDPQNRSNLIRKPEYEPGNEKATRLELRSPDPAANPYLAFAMMISAGLRGIEEKLPKPKPSDANVYHMSQKERDKKGIKSLPGSLEGALKLVEKGSLAREVLGEKFLGDFLRIKHADAEAFKSDPTHKKKDRLSNYELERLLPVL